MKKFIFVSLLLFALNSFCQEKIIAANAKEYLDIIVFVEGKVVSYKLASEGKSINYINIDKKFPENIFTVIVTNDWLPKLNLKIEDLFNKTVIIKGKISVYKNDLKQIPQIFNPESIELKN
jgi:hypothetical protein